MIRRMLWHTLIATLVVAGLGAAYQMFGPGTGLAALAGYTAPAKRHSKHHEG